MDVFVFAIGVTLVLFLVCLIAEWGHERAMRRGGEYPDEPLAAVLKRLREEQEERDLRELFPQRLRAVREERNWREFAKAFTSQRYFLLDSPSLSIDEIVNFHVANGTMTRSAVLRRIRLYYETLRLTRADLPAGENADPRERVRYSLHPGEYRMFEREIEDRKIPKDIEDRIKND